MWRMGRTGSIYDPQEFSIKFRKGCVGFTDSAYNQGAVNQVFFPCASRSANS